MSTSSAASDWANLPPEVILSLAERLPVSDVVRLRAVCGNWAWALGKSTGKRPRPSSPPAGKQSFFQPSPWLLLPYSAGEDTDECIFSSVTEYRLYTLSPLPQITGRRLLGSSRPGWLVTVDLLLTPRFFNPFTRQELPLPSLLTVPSNFSPLHSPENGSLSGFRYNQEDDPYSVEEFRDLFLKKIVLTSPPPQKGIAVAVFAIDIYRSSLAFARVGDEAWSLGPNLPQNFDFFEDVIYHEEDGKLYALSNRGAVFILELQNHSLEIVSMAALRIKEVQIESTKRYIFFSRGDLMQVARDLNYRNFTVGENAYFAFDSQSFKVFRFDPDCHNRHESSLKDSKEIKTDPRVCPHGSCWVPVTDIGDQFLLLGSSHCFSMFSADEEKRNKLLFIDDVSPWRKNSISEIGMFDLESGEIEDLGTSYGLSIWPPAVWFMPAPVLWD